MRRRAVADQLIDFVDRQCDGPGGGTPLLVAHNGAAFDFAMLSAEFERVGSAIPLHWAYMDTYQLTKVGHFTKHVCCNLVDAPVNSCITASVEP